MKKLLFLTSSLLLLLCCAKTKLPPYIPDTPDPQKGEDTEAVVYTFTSDALPGQEGEKIKLYFCSTETFAIEGESIAALSPAGQYVAKVAIDSTVSHAVTACYPANKFSTGTASTLIVALPSSQNIEAEGAFDEDVQVSTAKVTLAPEDRSAALAFDPLFKEIEITLTDPVGKYDQDVITDATITSKHNNLAGYYALNLENGDLTAVEESGLKAVVISSKEPYGAGSKIKFFAPKDDFSADTLTVRFESQNNVFVREYYEPQEASLSFAIDENCKVLKKKLFSGGAGTSEDPFRLETVYDWLDFCDYSNGENVPEAFEGHNFSVDSYKLTADLDLTGIENQSAAFVTKAFAGEFDGDGHTLTGIAISSSADHNGYGVFATTNGAAIKNLTLVNTSVTTSGAANLVGTLVGSLVGSKVSNCHAVGGQISKTKNPATGGLIGGCLTKADTIKNCSVRDLTLSVTAGDAVGGLVGRIQIDTYIESCAVKGASVIDAGKSKGVGGLVGRLDKASAALTIKDCVVGSGTIIKGQQWIGGILGAGFTGEQSASSGAALAYSYKVVIDGCAVYANIESGYTGSEYLCVGGICGAATTCNNATATDSYFIVANCLCDGSTIAATSYNASANVNMGGIVGKAGDKNATANPVFVVNCYAKDVKYSLSSFNQATRWAVGGIFGGSRQANVTIGNCYSTLTPDDVTLKGGIVCQIVPQIRSKVEYCFGLSGTTLLLCNSAQPALANSAQLTLDEFKAQSGVANALIDRLTTGAAAHSEKYHSEEPSLQGWTNSQEGYPTLVGALKDPDVL